MCSSDLGAYGREIVDVLVSAVVCDADGRREIAADGLGLRYRHSDLAPGQIVAAATIALEHDDPAAIRARVREHQDRRSAAQPRKARTFGSVFKNPEGDHAARLVEAAGCKGWTEGGATVSPKHANFIVAGKGSTSADVARLIERVRAAVERTAGVALEPEVKFVGEFPSAR